MYFRGRVRLFFTNFWGTIIFLIPLLNQFRICFQKQNSSLPHPHTHSPTPEYQMVDPLKAAILKLITAFFILHCMRFVKDTSFKEIRQVSCIDDIAVTRLLQEVDKYGGQRQIFVICSSKTETVQAPSPWRINKLLLMLALFFIDSVYDA